MSNNMRLQGLFAKEKKQSLDKGLTKSKERFFNKLGKAIVGRSSVDDEVLDELEEVLVSSDVGVDTTIKIIQRIEKRVAKDKYLNSNGLNRILCEEIAGLLSENKTNNLDFSEVDGLYVILVVGVNGAGKTTTIGKLASHLKSLGKNVVLGAADTFRAAAVDQLAMWGERAGVPVIKKGTNADPAAVAFETARYGLENNADVAIIDTAGRLHTKVNLMNELSKIKKVIQRFIPGAPHDVMLVLDGSTGQNAFAQAKEFIKATDVSSLAVTKLDGTAKGGVVIGISDQFKIPVKYIGLGEKSEDLQVFDKVKFVDSFFKKQGEAT